MKATREKQRKMPSRVVSNLDLNQIRSPHKHIRTNTYTYETIFRFCSDYLFRLLFSEHMRARQRRWFRIILVSLAFQLNHMYYLYSMKKQIEYGAFYSILLRCRKRMRFRVAAIVRVKSKKANKAKRIRNECAHGINSKGKLWRCLCVIK